MTTRVATFNTTNSSEISISRSAKRENLIYWTSTGIIAAIMFWSALNFAFNPAMEGAFAHLGLPNWFRVELTTAKLLGVVALLIPAVPVRIKEFAYSGFAIVLVSASVAHLSSGDPVSYVIVHSIFLVSLIVSNAYFRRRMFRLS